MAYFGPDLCGGVDLNRNFRNFWTPVSVCRIGYKCVFGWVGVGVFVCVCGEGGGYTYVCMCVGAWIVVWEWVCFQICFLYVHTYMCTILYGGFWGASELYMCIHVHVYTGERIGRLPDVQYGVNSSPTPR